MLRASISWPHGQWLWEFIGTDLFYLTKIWQWAIVNAMHSSRATLHCVDIVFGHPQFNNDPTNAKNEDTVFMGRCIAVSVILWEQPIDHASSSFLSFLNAAVFWCTFCSRGICHAIVDTRDSLYLRLSAICMANLA